MKKKLPIIFLSFIFSLVIWISVSLSKEYYYSIEIPLKFIGLKEGIGVSGNIPETLELKVKGIGWKLFSFKVSENVFFNITAPKDTGRTSLRLMNFIVENTWLPSDIQVIDINPPMIIASFDKAIFKTVKVSSGLKLDFKEGFGLAEPIKFHPDSVSVYGSYRTLSGIDNIITEEKIFSKLDRTLTENFKLKVNELIAVSPSEVKGNLNVQRIVDKELSNIEIIVNGLPNDRDVTLIPSALKVIIRGGIDIINKYSASDINVMVNYNEILRDSTGAIIPIIKLPENCELISIQPDRVRYIIKKFNK